MRFLRLKAKRLRSHLRTPWPQFRTLHKPLAIKKSATGLDIELPAKQLDRIATVLVLKTK